MKYIGIVGSRRRTEYKYIYKILDTLNCEKKIILVTGGARGIDQTAEEIADLLGIPKIIYLPNYAEYSEKGNDIYFERNKKIAEKSDMLFAFPYFRSGGTMNTIKHFKDLGKEGELIIVD